MPAPTERKTDSVSNTSFLQKRCVWTLSSKLLLSCNLNVRQEQSWFKMNICTHLQHHCLDFVQGTYNYLLHTILSIASPYFGFTTLAPPKGKVFSMKYCPDVWVYTNVRKVKTPYCGVWEDLSYIFQSKKQPCNPIASLDPDLRRKMVWTNLNLLYMKMLLCCFQLDSNIFHKF